LSTVTSVLQKCSSLDKADVPRYGVKAFDACYSLVSFFLQRFSKQTQNCLSCLFRSLMSMIEFVLYAPLTDTTLLECGQRFNRLCELLLPHGEVYKKHVLSLIIQFVKGLSKNVDVIRKKSLLNGIHCLFAIMQEHETKQLNSMLDEMERAVLLSVYEGYKKHTYKGQ
jgi:Urb2/Npa2 family